MRKDKKYAIVKMYFFLYTLSRFSRSHILPSFSVCLKPFDSSTSVSSSSEISLLEPLFLSRLFSNAPFFVSLSNPVPSISEARPDLAYSHITCFSWQFPKFRKKKPTSSACIYANECVYVHTIKLFYLIVFISPTLESVKRIYDREVLVIILGHILTCFTSNL